MEPTSAGWNPYGDVIAPGARVQFELVDVTAAYLVTDVEANVAGAAFTNIDQIYDTITENSLRLATLEPGLWELNGKYALPKESGNGEIGWWSDALSDGEGVLTPAVKVVLDTLQEVSSDGITVVFDTKTGEVASDFTVTTYENGAVVNQKAVVGNQKTVCVVDCPSAAYTRLEIVFTKTAKPYRRVRLTEVVFGYLQQFEGDRIVSLKLTRESSLYMDALPAGKMSVTIDNSDQAYNVLNPEGIYQFLQEGQGMNTAVSLNEETVNTGRFYFANATANDDALTATITAYDLIWRLDQGKCNIGASGSWSFKEAVAAIIEDSGVSVTVKIPAEIGARNIGKNIPKETTHREALRMAAQAAMTHLYMDRLDRLVAVDLAWDATVDLLNGERMMSWGEATDTGRINQVELTVSDDYTEDDEVVYVATNRKEGEPLQVLSVENPLAASAAVAQWILDMAGYRYAYSVSAQGNPARDVGDCIAIANVYGGMKNAVVFKQETNFAGSVTDAVTAYGK